MKKRFEGVDGLRRLVDVLREQRVVAGNAALAEDLASQVELLGVSTGQVIIQQGGGDNDMYFLLTGSCEIVVNNKRIAQRFAGEHVGEMAAIQSTQLRSASVIALEDGVVARLTEPALVSIGQRYPEIWRWIAKELARRLLQRNRFVADSRDKIRVFIISSVEALEIGRAVQNAFEHDGYQVVLWTNDVFRATFYPIESLEAELDVADFAIAIAQPDDLVKMRGTETLKPRDNVIFELGFFMGRLGRHRAILMEPRGEAVTLPTDLTGITTIAYKYAPGKELAAAISPACNRLRDIIDDAGPNN
jgi:predicted nucleotide-binding protein